MTSMPLLATKLHIPPPRPHSIFRPRLVDQLEDGVRQHHGLMLISAPAGSGKTTLISEWLHHADHAFAWLSLDPSDNDPPRFLAYLIAALQHVDPRIGQTAQELPSLLQGRSIPTLMAILINDIAAVSGASSDRRESLPDGDLARELVRDDYQIIEEREAHEAVTFLIDHQPDQLHLVIATREDPPLPLSRLRASGLLTEIRESDLGFTEEEATAFLNETMHLRLPPDEIAALQARTEGWIAGLQLSAISMRKRSDTRQFVDALTGTHRYILSYLTDEVLRQQSEQTRDFLLRTSILSRLCGPLCDAVTGQQGGQATLEELERGNLFILPLDDEQRWFRYHRLFGDLLRHYLRQEVGAQGLASLHRTACFWLAENGLPAEALPHAIAAEDFERAADLVESMAQTVLVRGEGRTLLRWIEALPPELVRRRPYLCLVHAWTLHETGQVDTIEPRLQDTERAMEARALPPDDPFAREMRGRIASLRASNARRRNDLPGLIRYSKDALALLPKDDLLVRSIVSMNLGIAYMLKGDLAAAMAACDEARSKGQASGNEQTVLNATGFLAAILIAQGRLHQASELCQQAIEQHCERYPAPLSILAHVHACLARVLYEWDDLDGAAAHLEQAAILEQDTHLPRTMRFPASMLAAISQIQRRGGGGSILAEKVAAIVARDEGELRDADFTAWRVRMWLVQGNLYRAARWAQSYQAGEALPLLWRPYGDLALARVLIAQRRFADAQQTLARVSQQAHDVGAAGWLIEVLVLQTLALQAVGKTDEALGALSQALALAEPEGYVRTFIDEGDVMVALLRQVGLRGVLPEYVSRLLAACGAAGQAKQRDAEPAPQLQEALSGRERDVLRLLAAGLSNQQIADELCVSLNTVRTHTKRLYSKLDVHSRAHAASRARALKLL
jgi:LuxR family maltose regulon positive regulatory protein